jgi:tRNA pseudouridine55 synthase
MTDQLYNGLLLVDKPVGISSFDVIRQLRRITHWRKIGHAGTLDPAASGLMLMLFGPACKQAQAYSKLDKRYRAEITLGKTSSTGDREGELTKVSDRVPTQAEVEAALAQLTGEIIQTPPAYSAIKIHGQEAYKRVRAGEVVDMPSRTVQVYENHLLAYAYPMVQLECRVSSGTYIRTLAADLGDLLQTGAYLSALKRTEVGEYSLVEAVQLEDLTPSTIHQALLPSTMQ